MPRSKDDEHEPLQKRGHDEEHRRRHKREREESGDDPKRHASIIERRWLGSPPPTAERYAGALRQWQNLSGTGVLPAAGVPGVAPGSSVPGSDRLNSAGEERES